MNKQKQQKFLVVSYDDDQQQWFWDYVVSTTELEAVALVCKRRPYVIAADAASLPQIQTMANDLSSRSHFRINQQFRWDTPLVARRTHD
jgi:hypothetical protein